jgi:hypothetical protein
MRILKILLATALLHGCCSDKEPALPTIETPYGYDELKKIEVYYNEADPQRLSLCNVNSYMDHSYKNVKILKDSFPKIYEKCFDDSERFTSIDYKKYNLVFAELGSTGQVIRSKMNYGIFVNHKERTLKIQVGISTSGSCAGSGLTSHSYRRAFLLPKSLESYSIILK